MVTPTVVVEDLDLAIYGGALLALIKVAHQLQSYPATSVSEQMDLLASVLADVNVPVECQEIHQQALLYFATLGHPEGVDIQEGLDNKARFSNSIAAMLQRIGA
jgi:hypothetical protein